MFAPTEALTFSRLHWICSCLCLYSCWLDQEIDVAYLCMSRMSSVYEQGYFIAQRLALTTWHTAILSSWIPTKGRVLVAEPLQGKLLTKIEHAC